MCDLTALQVLQEASEHFPGLHPRDCLHVELVWLPCPADLLQVDSLHRPDFQGCSQPAHPLYQHVSLQLRWPHQQTPLRGTGAPSITHPLLTYPRRTDMLESCMDVLSAVLQSKQIFQCALLSRWPFFRNLRSSFTVEQKQTRQLGAVWALLIDTISSHKGAGRVVLSVCRGLPFKLQVLNCWFFAVLNRGDNFPFPVSCVCVCVCIIWNSLSFSPLSMMVVLLAPSGVHLLAITQYTTVLP